MAGGPGALARPPRGASKRRRGARRRGAAEKEGDGLDVGGQLEVGAETFASRLKRPAFVFGDAHVSLGRKAVIMNPQRSVALPTTPYGFSCYLFIGGTMRPLRRRVKAGVGWHPLLLSYLLVLT